MTFCPASPLAAQTALYCLQLFGAIVFSGGPIDLSTVPARDNMEMHVRHNLRRARPVILEHIEPVTRQALQKHSRHPPHRHTEGSYLFGGQIGEIHGMTPGHNQNMPLFKRRYVKKSDGVLVFVHLVAGYLPGHDLAEHAITVCHGYSL